MITGTSLTESEDFISKFDDKKTEADGATIWVIGALDANIRAYIGDNTTYYTPSIEGDSRIYMRNATRNTWAVKFGLRGLRNFRDKDDNIVAYKTVVEQIGGEIYNVLAPEILDMIPLEIMSELGNEIISRNTISAVVKKK